MSKTFESVYNSLKKEAVRDLEQGMTVRKRYRFFLPAKAISEDQFTELLILKANTILVKRGEEPDFFLDERSGPLAKQLYLWLVGDKRFNGDVGKGILFGGLVGTGKTILLQAFVGVYSMLSNRQYSYIGTDEIKDFIRQYDREWWQRRIIMLDDIGREPMEMKDWGNKTLPIPYVIAIRYDSGGLTFGTTNFPLAPAIGYKGRSLQEFYGEYIIDRMRSMFNFIVYPGETRRK